MNWEILRFYGHWTPFNIKKNLTLFFLLELDNNCISMLLAFARVVNKVIDLVTLNNLIFIYIFK